MNRGLLVFLNSKHNNGFTYEPQVVSLERRGKIYRVGFMGGRVYNYSPENVRYYERRKTYQAVRIYEDGRLVFQYDELDDYGDYLVGYNQGRAFDPIRKHRKLEITPIKTDIERGQQLLACYRAGLEQGLEITHELPHDEAAPSDQDKRGIADMQLSTLARIDLSESRSVCAHYFSGENPLVPAPSAPLIYPFGCNESQKKAVEMALSHTISVVEGPPGTGKTQTILNIIANLVVQGKTVAIVSNNNTAVFNVRDKLARYGYGGLVASLGNKVNRAAFFEELPTLKVDECSRLDPQSLQEERAEVARVGDLLSESFRVRSRLAQLRADLLEAEQEQCHVLQEQPLDSAVYAILESKFLRKLDYHGILRLRQMLERILHEAGRVSWGNRLRLLFSFGLLDQRSLRRYESELPIYLNHKFYELYISYLRAEIDTASAWLEAHSEAEQMQELTACSRRLFDAMLLERRFPAPSEPFTAESYKGDFECFVQHYPIVTSSTLSLPMCIPQGYLFDYLIIDEASQVDSIKAVISFACARRAVIVGDSMQLAHIVDAHSQALADEFFTATSLPPAYDYVRYSILTSLKVLLGERLPTVLLREHYRCHPAIIGFCNKKYYDGQLIVMSEGGGCPFKIIEVNIADGGNDYSQRQIDETKAYLATLDDDTATSVGVVAPYRLHADKLKAELPQDVEADTIHRYQGREKDVIIFNTVRPKITEFMDNPNLINVAVSRAVREFILVKPEGMELPHGTNVGDLVRYMMYYAPEACSIVKGQLRSVFDILYRKLGTDEGRTTSQMYDAEDLVCKLLLEEVLPSSSVFASLTFAREYSLRDLVRDVTGLSSEEQLYIKHYARLDILLYSRIDKAPILAIEVDGVTFHTKPEQQQRDRMKNHILEVIGLPLLRLPTDGHSEGTRITEALMEAMTLNE